MSQLHPTDEDYAFERGHEEAGRIKREKFIKRLQLTLSHVIQSPQFGEMNRELREEIVKCITRSFYDEDTTP